MRVITGSARGRKLKEPTGKDIRPTTSMVKEAIFNIVQFDIPGREVLDLFAGTGQMGIEALSRGALSCDFVDASKLAVGLVKDNLAHCDLPGGRVFLADAAQFLAPGKQYDLIFVDPPYDDKRIDDIIAKIAQFDILRVNGIMMCETKLDKTMPDLPHPYEKSREYRYGKVKLTRYTRRED